VNERDVLFVYREATIASYCNVTLVMASGEEISGRALTHTGIKRPTSSRGQSH
jgi:hypothetical protein